MVKVATWVPDDLAERVRRAAEKEDRSVSQWLRLLLERELERQSWSEGLPAKTAGLVSADEVRRQEDPPPRVRCQHAEVRKVKGEGGGLVKECRTCGVRLLR